MLSHGLRLDITVMVDWALKKQVPLLSSSLVLSLLPTDIAITCNTTFLEAVVDVSALLCSRKCCLRFLNTQDLPQSNTIEDRLAISPGFRPLPWSHGYFGHFTSKTVIPAESVNSNHARIL